MSEKPSKYVEIVWEDAHGGDLGWEELPKSSHKPEQIRTVGILHTENDKGYTVILSKYVKGARVGGFIFVPKACVTSFRELT